MKYASLLLAAFILGIALVSAALYWPIHQLKKP